MRTDSFATREAGRRAGAKGASRARAPRPDFAAPALCTLVDDVPEDRGWIFEQKLDGYRILVAASGRDVVLHTRNGLDWTARFRPIADAAAALDLDGALIDGEVVVLDGKGRSDFGALQAAMQAGRRDFSLFAFDLLALGGKDLRRRPLLERKQRLRDLLGETGRTGPIFYSEHREDGAAMLATLCADGYEGVVAKRADAPYPAGRGRTWLKIKCGHVQEFVVVGWSPSTRGRSFSSLLLAVNGADGLRYAGRIGSGFSGARLADLSRRLAALALEEPPLDTRAVPRATARAAHWVKPELVVEVAFAGFTGDGLVRQGRFLGLREDKPAASVVREEPKPVETTVPAAKPPVRSSKGRAEAPPGTDPVISGVRLTHPDRVLYPEQGVTKRDLATYLAAAAPRMMPYVANHLVSLVRCPAGRAKQCFFQRHVGAGLDAHFAKLPVTAKNGSREDYVYLPDAAALVAAAQIGVLEIHVWGSRIDDIERPDRIVFDLDPDEGVPFQVVTAAALRLRDELAALKLRSFALATGGKGVHVVVPIQRRHDWATVKAFSAAVANRLVAEAPDAFVATMSKAKRKGRIFIDYFRNERGASAIAPYSPRAREGAPVAWPVSWEALPRLESARVVRLADAVAALAGPDPWADYATVRQSISAAARRRLGI